MDSCGVPSGFFSTVKYYVIGKISSAVEKLLIDGGAKKHQYLSDILTHCIADEFDEEIAEAKELFRLNVIKLNKKDHLLMWGLTTLHNGNYKVKFDHTITHLISNSTSGVKYDHASTLNVKVVCTQWIIDCVNLKKRLSESQYHPKHFTICAMSPMTENSQGTLDDGLLGFQSTSSEVLQQVQTQHDCIYLETSVGARDLSAKSFLRGELIDSHLKEYSSAIEYFGHDPNENLPTGMFLHGCVFHISDYQIELEEKEIELLKQIIEVYGGKVDEQYSARSTHILCEHQRSNIFQQALKDNKRIVTVCWLNDCLLENRMVVPSSILHVPHPFGKEKPCSNQIMSITNFDGSERKQIKKIILMLGAAYSGCMTKAVSVLVAKIRTGPKYNKAMEWDIPVVSTEWLIELAFGNFDAMRFPLSEQFLNFDWKGFCNISEKLSHLLS